MVAHMAKTRRCPHGFLGVVCLVMHWPLPKAVQGQREVSWMRQRISRNTARSLCLPVPGYWNQLWERRATTVTGDYDPMGHAETKDRTDGPTQGASQVRRLGKGRSLVARSPSPEAAGLREANR